MTTVNNPLRAVLDIVGKPNGVFATIKLTHNWSWVPFLLISLSAILPVYTYFHHIDFGWYQNTMLAEMSDEQQQQIQTLFQPNTMVWASVISSLATSIVANALFALYLNTVSKRDEECVQEFTDWYGFTWWISLPVILFNLLSTLIILASSDPQLSVTTLSPTSMAFIFSVAADSPWLTFAMSMRLETLWIIYLCAVGLGQWTAFSAKKCYVLAALPFAGIGLIWASILAFG